jgi:sulfur-oxidizing protein SoxZ
MKIKAKRKNGKTIVKFMAKHISLSVDQAKRRGKVANYITNVIAKNNDELVFEGSLSQSVSANPYIKFYYNGGNKGDTLSVKWKDLLGKEKEGKVKLK